MDADTYAFDESRLLMIPAQRTDRINDIIHLPQGRAVHCLIQRMEVGLDFVIVHDAGFAVGFVQYSEDESSLLRSGGEVVLRAFKALTYVFRSIECNLLDKLCAFIV